jgi:hypothetical protein
MAGRARTEGEADQLKGSIMRFFFIGPRILGIRPGISFSANELLRLATKPKQNKPGEPMTGSFLYVIRGDHNMIKVGVTTNPNARLAQLRTASAFPIDYSYLAVTPGTGFDIEAGSHEMLKSHRCNGEWFDVPPEMGVAAIAGAAHKLGQPILPVTAEVANQILQVCAQQDAAASGRAPSSHFLRDLIMSAIVVCAWVWIIAHYIFG